MAEAAIEERVARLEGRVESFAPRFDSLEHQIHALQLRIDGMDQRLATRIDGLDRKIDRNFHWSTGINVVLWSTILVALVFRV